MSRTMGRRGAAAAGVALAVLTACGGEGDTNAEPTSTAWTSRAQPSTGPNSGTAFDPCTALTPQFLAQHQWDARPPAPRQNSTGGFTWKGCLYVARSTYTFRVETTDGALDQVREKFPAATDITVDGRKALRYEARPDVPGGCTVDIEMTTGSLYILVDDPSGRHPRKLSPCDNATEIAEAVVPLLPADS